MGGLVPEVSRFFGIVIRIYFKDHAPPHFHAEYAGTEARIEIVSGRILSGRLAPRADRLVRDWLELHRLELLADWQLAAARRPLNPIAPLE